MSLRALNNTEASGRAAIIAPMAADMNVSSTAAVGVAEKQQVMFTGIKAIFEQTLTPVDSIKLLSCFSVEEKNGAIATASDDVTQVSPMLDVSLMADKAADFKSILTGLFDNALQVAGNGPITTNGMPVSDLLSDGMRTTINSLLSDNDLLDLLEANNVMNVTVTMEKEAGAEDMYKAIAGLRAGANVADIKAKRRLFLTQIPKATLESYLLENTSAISFLPLKGGDSMTFVFDIKVTPPSNISAVVKDATADNHTGVNAQNGQTGISDLGGYLDQGSSVTINGAPEYHRVAFVAHLGSKVAPFAQTYSDAQYSSLPEPAVKDKAGYKAEFVKKAGAILAGAEFVVPAGLATAVANAEKDVRATVESLANAAKVTAQSAYTAALAGGKSLASATVNEIKRRVALEEIKDERNRIASSLTTATGNHNTAAAAFNTANTVYESYVRGLADAESVWGTAGNGALAVLAGLENNVSGLSQELHNARILAADASDEYYPIGGSTPTKKADLQAEVTAKQGALSNAETAYQNAPSDSTNLGTLRETYNLAVQNLYIAELNLGRKDSIMASLNTPNGPAAALAAALAAFTANMTQISANKTSYNAAYTTVHSSITSPTIFGVPYVDQNNSGTRVAYAESPAGVTAVVPAPSPTDSVNALLAKERLQVLKDDITLAIGDGTTPATGMQELYNEAKTVYDAVVAAEAAFIAAVQAHSSAVASVASLGMNGSVKASEIAARNILASAKADLAKAQAKAELLAEKLAAYVAGVAAISPMKPTGAV